MTLPGQASASRASEIAGLIVMGGRATRMGGRDKALIEIGGRTVLSRVVERFAPQVRVLALSANGDPARFAAFELDVLSDPEGPPDGPLAGVITGLAWAREVEGVRHLATLPGDAPCPPDDIVARLAAAAGAGAAAAHGPAGIEPLHALWPVSALPRLREASAQGLISPKRALGLIGAAAVAFDDPHAFLDLDEPVDVARAESVIGRA